MSEKEILDKIEKSAAQEKIPESIEPEQIKRKLKENQKNKVKRRSGITYYGAVAAAALVLVIGAAGGIHAVTGGGTGLMTAPVGIEKAASGQKSDEGSEGSSELKDGATAGVEKNAQKKDAGSLYTVAKNYGEVYDAICSGSGQEKEADGIAVAEGDSSNSGDAATYIMDDTSDTVDAARRVEADVQQVGRRVVAEFELGDGLLGEAQHGGVARRGVEHFVVVRREFQAPFPRLVLVFPAFACENDVPVAGVEVASLFVERAPLGGDV